MTATSQAQHFGAIRIEGQGNQLVINQVVQISTDAVLSRPFLPASPYRGLEAFDDKHSHLFFGRDALIAKLITAVPQHPLLMVSGASGSGKSSVVRAGLLPQLAQRAQGLRAFDMKPGSDPFVALKYSLIRGGLKENKVDFAATAHPDSLTKLAVLRPQGQCWLLLIDQFEELFTLCDADKRRAFFAGLVSLATACPIEFRIVLTMRSDFFDRFDLYPELLEHVRRGLSFVTSPTVDELRQCIEQPAAQHGVVFEKGLVKKILDEIESQPGALPLLQYMLALLWEEDKPAGDRTLNTSSYTTIRGVKGALCQRADMVYAHRDDEPRSESEQQMMRRIFLRLVEVSGQGDSAPMVSRRRLLAQFSQAEQTIVRELVEEKLLVSNLDETAAQGGAFDRTTVELGHESLIAAWPTLAEWLKEARQVLFIRGRLSHDAAEWQRLRQQNPDDARRAEEELWSGTRLANALEMCNRGDFRIVLGGLSAEEEAFLSASEAAVAERLRREREAAEKIRQLLLDSYIERGHQLLFKEGQPYPAALWLHRAYKEGSTNLSLPYLLRSAMTHIDATKRVFCGHGGEVHSVSFSPDGRRIATGSSDQTARVWDVQDGRLVAELKGHADRVFAASFSPDGQRIVTASDNDPTARLWNAQDGRLVAELEGHAYGVKSASFSLDGRRIVTASDDETARVWDAQDGRLLLELRGDAGPISKASFSPDGRQVVTASHRSKAQVWDTQDGRLLVELKGHERWVQSASFSPDGRRIVTASEDWTARVWNAQDGQLLAELKELGSPVLIASFSPDGQRIVIAYRRGNHTARIWDGRDGTQTLQLKGHTGDVTSASFSPDGQQVVTASLDQTARVWDAQDGRLLAELKGHGGPLFGASFSATSRQVVTASQDRTARVWDLTDERLVAELKGYNSRVHSVNFSPDSRCIVAGMYKTAGVWEAANGQRVAKFEGHEKDVLCASFSPEGRRIVTASSDHTARVWDAEDGSVVAELKGHTNDVLCASFSPEGRRIVTASSDHTARVWDAKDGSLVAELKGHTNDVLCASFSPEGRRIVTITRWDKTARVWDAQDGRLLLELTGHSSDVRSASFSPEGRRIVTASDDETARIWDAQSGQLLAELKGHTGPVRSASFSSDGRRIVTASFDQEARVWDAQDGRLLIAFRGHRGDIPIASFSPDGRRIATASDDRTACVWDAAPETRTPEQVARHIRDRSCVRFSSEDSNVIVRCTPPAEILSA